MEGEVKGSNDEGDLENQPGEGIERVASPKVTAVVELVNF